MHGALEKLGGVTKGGGNEVLELGRTGTNVGRMRRSSRRLFAYENSGR